ncbi:MAG: hypothetical protein C0418_02365 [Coriobacteriaceae bacterium]|nr:hypothetical protein [Coriobacteriaceae bacterium]
MTPRADYLARREARDRRALAAERLWWLVVSAVSLGVLVCAVIAGAAVSPRTCALCHGSVQRAAASAHTQVRCDRCHAGEGAGGLIDQRLRVIGMVVRAPFSGEATRATHVSNRVCLSCHADVLERTVATAGLKMSHREPEAAAWSCVGCHVSSGHGASPSFRGRYTMGMCLACHSVDPRNVASCTKCHTTGQDRAGRDPGRTPWRAIHGPGWRTLHGMGELATCKACHLSSRCVECHNMPIPHPVTFKKLHGREVIGLADGDKNCLVCHKAGACDSCHGLPMPHPERFLQGHSDVVAAKGRAVCERCHEPSSCLDCHVRHIHPGLSDELLRQLLARPVRP